MKNSIALLGMLSLSVFCFAQNKDSRFVDRGLLRVQGNLAFGKSLSASTTNMYFAGDLDYFIDPNISVRGGAQYFLGSFGPQALFTEKHAGFLGASYHIKTKGKMDPYVGMMPGFAISRLTAEGAVEEEGHHSSTSIPRTINPLWSLHTGLNYYASKYFNFFVHLQYATGSHFSQAPSVSLDEMTVAFGLGYMLWAREGKLSFDKPF